MIWFLAGWALCATLLALIVGRILKTLDQRNQDLHNRLLAAWKQGYVIPPANEPEPEPSPNDELPDWAADWLDQWEAGAGREKWRSRVLTLSRKYGWDKKKILTECEEPSWS